MKSWAYFLKKFIEKVYTKDKNPSVLEKIKVIFNFLQK